MSKILIIGSSGFIGKPLLNAIKKYDVQVIGAGRQKFTYDGNIYKVDIFQPESYIELIQKMKPDILISTVWNTKLNFWNSEMNEMFYKAHKKLFKIGYESGVRNIVGFGTAAEYGTYNLNCKAGKSKLIGENEYGHFKQKTGSELQRLANEFNQNYLWLRIFQVYGVGEPDYRLIPTVLQSIRENNFINISSPSKVLDWIYIDDVVDAIIYLLFDKVCHGVFDIGSNIGTTVKEIVQVIIGEYNISGAQVVYEFSEKPLQGLVCSEDIDLFKLKWSPKIDVKTGIKKMIAT